MAKRIACILAAATVFFIVPAYKVPAPKPHSPLSKEEVSGPSGNKYTFFYKNSARMDFETVRPSQNDTNVLLCIPGAFTVLADYSIDGLYICKGKTGNRNKINHTLGGAIKIVDGEASVFPTGKGKKLNDSLISVIESKKGSLFQQIQMVENGVPAKFKDVKLFQRRGIVIMKNGKTGVVESGRAVTLKTFAEDMAVLGAKDLLYTDMGSWDYGWYRDPANGSVMPLGYDHSQTDKQSNWVVFKKG